MRLVDLFWMTRPEFTANAMPTWLDIVVPIALVGLVAGILCHEFEADAAVAPGRSETCGGDCPS